MTQALRSCCCVPLLAGVLAAQAYPQNKLEHTNWWLDSREDLFPNYGSATGNAAGDGLFKVIPAEVLERDGNHRISGYKLGFSIDDAFTGTLQGPTEVPGMQLHRTKVQTLGGKTYETLDPGQKVGPRFDPIVVAITADNSWVVEMSFDPNAADPKLKQLLSVPALVNGQRAGLAMLLLAKPGDKRSPSNPGVVLLASYRERHIQPGRESYSGAFAAPNAVVTMYGGLGQPSASGELYAALRFADPTLQVYGSSSGGVANDPQNLETHLGPGAYATDLPGAAQPGFLGLFIQGAQFEGGANPTHLAFPFVVATGIQGPTTSFPLGGGLSLRVHPGELDLAGELVSAGLFGPIKRYLQKGSAGWDEDQVGVYQSGRVPVPNNPAFSGVNLWLQALVTDVSLQPVATTNVVRLTLR